MRSAIAYTTARILLFVAATGLLYLIGARGLLLLGLALVISGIASYVLLSRQRDAMSGALAARLGGMRGRLNEFRTRLDEGTRAEDADDPEPAGRAGPAAARSQPAATQPAAGPQPVATQPVATQPAATQPAGPQPGGAPSRPA